MTVNDRRRRRDGIDLNRGTTLRPSGKDSRDFGKVRAHLWREGGNRALWFNDPGRLSSFLDPEQGHEKGARNPRREAEVEAHQKRAQQRNLAFHERKTANGVPFSRTSRQQLGRSRNP